MFPILSTKQMKKKFGKKRNATKRHKIFVRKSMAIADVQKQIEIRRMLEVEEERRKRKEEEAKQREDRRIRLTYAFHELAMQLLDVKKEDANTIINEVQKMITSLKEKN